VSFLVWFLKKKTHFGYLRRPLLYVCVNDFLGVAGNCNVEAPTHVELEHEANGVRLHVREPAVITISGKLLRVLTPSS
jgi:hypothetical protein